MDTEYIPPCLPILKYYNSWQGQNREGQRTYYTGLSSIKEGEKVRYYLYNHRGDTVLVTGGDGEIIHNLSYEAYGKATDKLGYPIGSVNIETGGGAGSSGAKGSGSFPALFVGGAGIRYDVKTNLHYMRFRWFSPDQMRFISKDLLMDENRYAYTGGDPVNYIDPTGLNFGSYPPMHLLPEIDNEYASNDITTIKFGKRYSRLRRNRISIDKFDDRLRLIIKATKGVLKKRNEHLSSEEPMQPSGVFGNVAHCESTVEQFYDITNDKPRYDILDELINEINEALRIEQANSFRYLTNPEKYEDIFLISVNVYYAQTNQAKHELSFYNTGHHYIYLEFITSVKLSYLILLESNATGAGGENFGSYLIEPYKQKENRFPALYLYFFKKLIKMLKSNGCK